MHEAFCQTNREVDLGDRARLQWKTSMSHRDPHLTAKSSILLRRAGDELPLLVLLLFGAATPLQCLLSVFVTHFVLLLLRLTQPDGVPVPCLCAARGRPPAGGLHRLAPGAVALLHLAAPAAAAVGRLQVFGDAG